MDAEWTPTARTPPRLELHVNEASALGSHRLKRGQRGPPSAASRPARRSGRTEGQGFGILPPGGGAVPLLVFFFFFKFIPETF